MVEALSQPAFHHHEIDQTSEGDGPHLAFDILGNESRQRGLSGSGIAEQAKAGGVPLQPGDSLEPVGNGLQRGILMWGAGELSCSEG